MFGDTPQLDLVYLIGAPGVGKSTVMAELTEGLPRVPRSEPFAHDWLHERIDGFLKPPVAVELGARREAFSGTDALGMAVNPRACEWIGLAPAPLVLGEGDRLANARFLGAAQRAGYAVTLAYLVAGSKTLEQRRAARGSTQSEQWIKGRVTKADNLAARGREEGWRVIRIDTSAFRPDGVARLIRAQAPALKVLGEVATA
jgi:hypothetical protein